MSDIRTEVQKCPHCSKESELTIYSSINVTLDPNLKKKILDSSIFEWECPYCHEKFDLVYDFLYHDMDADYMMFFDPHELPANEYKEDAEFPPMPSIFKMDTYQLRQVHGLNRLKEKIKIIDDKFSDIVIEFVKLSVKIHNEELRVCDIYYESKKDDSISFTFFNNETKKWGSFSMPMDAYDSNKSFVEQNEEFAPAKNKCPEINEAWVHECIKRYMSTHENDK